MEVVNRFAVLSGGEKVRQETLVIGDSIVRLVDDVLCRYRVTVHNDTSLELFLSMHSKLF